jgi:hypothetical protein
MFSGSARICQALLRYIRIGWDQIRKLTLGVTPILRGWGFRTSVRYPSYISHPILVYPALILVYPALILVYPALILVYPALILVYPASSLVIVVGGAREQI